MLQQPARRILHQVEHELEPLRSARIRVGHRRRILRVEFGQQPDLVRVLARREALERAHVLLVHREHVVEGREVLLLDRASA